MSGQTEHTPDRRTFGEWVKQRRKALGFTQAELAQRVTCSKSLINKIESDLRSPTKPMLAQLSLHLKIPPAEYADFVHRAQPQLLLDPGDFSNAVGAKPALKVQPVPLTPLIGREVEVAAVCSALQRSELRLLTLTGAGGTGKTRLALQVATELIDKFADGVYFVSLAPVHDSALVLSTIVQTLGLKSTHEQRDDELLSAYLYEKSVLLILDNFEQALPATKAIAELLKFTTSVKILVTSRTLLHLSGEHEYVVPPLTLPDLTLAVNPVNLADSSAVRLFVQRAQAVRADFQLTAENAQSVAEICAWLDGLPLAIELAAARCKVLSPSAILARLTGAMGGALGLLAGGVQDLPARQQTIRQTIEWSYNLLSEQEQILFRRLGVFVGGCTLDAIQAVCETFNSKRLRPGSSFSVLDAALALVDQSVLRQVDGPDGEPRFFMSETLREYAFESLSGCQELELMRYEHAAYFLCWLEALEPKLHGVEQEAYFQVLDADYNNLRAALTWSSVSDPEMALRMAAVLWEFWLARGYLTEGRAWLTDILRRSSALPALPARIHAQALNGAGLLASIQGDPSAANLYLQESLRLFRELGDRMGEAWVLNHLGQTLNLSGQQAQAGPVFEASLQLFRALGDNLHSAWVLINLGEASLQDGQVDRALQFLSEASQLFGVLNHKRGLAAAIDRLARLALLQGNTSQAVTLFSDSLRLFAEIGDREGCGWALHHLGSVAYEDGQISQAVANLVESLRLFEKLNDRWGFAWSVLRLAKAVRDLPQPKPAAKLFGAAETMLDDLNERMLPSERDFVQATLLEARSQSEAADWASGQNLSNEKILAWILEQSFLAS
jgi:predicted ATPase/transcriptional regulator with XRE-family HTH domain